MKKIQPWFDYSFPSHDGKSSETTKIVTRFYSTNTANIGTRNISHNGFVMPSLFIDENVKRDIASAFRDVGCCVCSVQEVGLKSKPDPVIFQFAAENDLVLVTHDFDFLNANRYALSQSGGLIHLTSALNERSGKAVTLMNAIVHDFSAVLLEQIDTWKGTAVRYKTNGEVTITTSVPQAQRDTNGKAKPPFSLTRYNPV